MFRRTFLAASLGAVLAGPALAEMLDYSDGMVRDRLAQGETVFVDFSASWCGTCRAQGRAIEALRAENPAYDAGITFIKVDWDTWKSGMLASELAIPRRSTLVVLKGDAELGRIVANTRKEDIKTLMDTALTAAAS